MRYFLLPLVAALALPALGQSTARSRPPGTAPLEELEPPPPLKAGNDALEPQVTERKEAEQTIQEYRIGGKLYMMRVIPAHGRPYILVDHKGDGQFARQDNLDNGVRVPQWVILEWK
jgi:Protein of unknown function (DUF2782)